MKLQAKIGFGFGILVLTCLGLTLGTYFSVATLSGWETARNGLEEQQRFYSGTIVPAFCKARLDLGGENSSVALSGLAAVLREMQEKVAGRSELYSLLEAAIQAVAGGDGVTLEQIDSHAARIGSGVKVELEQPAGERQAQIGSLLQWIKWVAVFLSVVGTIAGIVISYGISRMITRPINITIEKVKEIAKGNLAITIPVLTRDEIGSLARAMNQMTDSLNEMFGKIQQNSTILNAASSELSTLSGRMMENSAVVGKETEAASVSADSLSRNMSDVAGAMEESTMSVNAVVAAIEEMTATIGEISRDSQQGREITESAVNEAENASRSLSELGHAADEINKVTETINEIADQTNLLALNATIEAARAGEAGKGFAVVANEIKALASQTTTATKEIRARIEGVQQSSSQVVTVMQSIIDTINRVNEIVSSISSSVSEQATVSGEISSNVHLASSGMNSVNNNISASSVLNQSMATDLASVRNKLQEMLHQCKEVTEAAVAQKKIAEDLKEYSSHFTLK